jgi:hypothetical protein
MSAMNPNPNSARTGPTTDVDPVLWSAMSGEPGREMEAIIVSTGGLDALLAQLPEDVTVDHMYRLINSVSVRTSAGTLRSLVGLPMIKAIEGVRPVSACDDPED